MIGDQVYEGVRKLVTCSYSLVELLLWLLYTVQGATILFSWIENVDKKSLLLMR